APPGRPAAAARWRRSAWSGRPASAGSAAVFGSHSGTWMLPKVGPGGTRGGKAGRAPGGRAGRGGGRRHRGRRRLVTASAGRGPGRPRHGDPVAAATGGPRAGGPAAGGEAGAG